MDFKFVRIRDLTEDLFKAYPVWILYEDPEQDEEISSWGVDLENVFALTFIPKANCFFCS